MGQVAMCETSDDMNIDQTFIVRHSAYWAKAHCIDMELRGDSKPMPCGVLSDKLGLHSEYIYPLLSRIRKNISAR